MTPQELQALLLAYRSEFVESCRERGMDAETAEACRVDFERDVLADHLSRAVRNRQGIA